MMMHLGDDDDRAMIRTNEQQERSRFVTTIVNYYCRTSNPDRAARSFSSRRIVTVAHIAVVGTEQRSFLPGNIARSALTTTCGVPYGAAATHKKHFLK